MNARRGFTRLFFAAATCWYVFGGLYVYEEWSTYFSTQKANMDHCLDAVHDPGPSVFRVTDAWCQAAWGRGGFARKSDSNEWVDTVILGSFPVLLYGAGEIAGWIARGFQNEVPHL